MPNNNSLGRRCVQMEPVTGRSEVNLMTYQMRLKKNISKKSRYKKHAGVTVGGINWKYNVL
jgi:hypothetical protein